MFRPKICLDARLIEGIAGGVQQVLVGLATGFSELKDGDEEYYFLTYRNLDSWIRPFLRGPCIPLPVDAPFKIKIRNNSIYSYILPIYQRLKKLKPLNIKIPASDGTIEKIGVDLIHFTTQIGFLTSIPSLYCPHDLQHLHFPHFFSASELSYREHLYKTFCQQAKVVIAMTKFGKNDLIKNYGLSEDKIKIVPWAPSIFPNPTSERIEQIKTKFNLPEKFIFYPAQTWEHKNHINLLIALSIIIKDNKKIYLVCSGFQNEFYKHIKKKVQALKLENNVKFVGFINREDVGILYKLAEFTIFPSRFEGWGLPILESISSGTPVACSNIEVFKEQLDEAVHYFNPEDPYDIAKTILQLWTDQKLRDSLKKKGKTISQKYTWLNTAILLRSIYRKTIGLNLTIEDLEIFNNS